MSDNVSEFSERSVDFEFSSDIMTERGTIQTYFIPKGTNFKGCICNNQINKISLEFNCFAFLNDLDISYMLLCCFVAMLALT